jgi:hypothetical protein
MSEKRLSAHSTAEVVIEEVRIDIHGVRSHNFRLWKGRVSVVSAWFRWWAAWPGDLYHLRLALHYI